MTTITSNPNARAVKEVIVITPAKKAARTIPQTIDSIALNAGRLEGVKVKHLIICPKDDTATKQAAEQAWNSHNHSAVEVKILEDIGKGIYSAMNQGLEYVTNLLEKNDQEPSGRLIVNILNADDSYNDKCLKKVVSAFNSDPNIKCAYGNLCFVDQKSSSSIVRLWIAGKLEPWKFLFGWMPPHPTVFFDAAVYSDHRFKPESFETSSDYELMLRLLYRKGLKVKYLNNVLVFMRAGGASSRTRFKALKCDYKALRANGVSPPVAALAVISKKARAVLQIVKTKIKGIVKSRSQAD